MNRKELKKEIINLYAKCGSYIMTLEQKEANGFYITKFAHPTKSKIIEVTETWDEVKSVFVYNRTSNAAQRHAIECKTIEQFINAI